jgi:hypothetical protein
MRGYNPDLTSFAALLGDSFSSKINLLTQIIQGNHYPSVGRYKERLLANLIAQYIPKNYEVATGFVLFAQEATDERAKKPGFDELNMCSHTLSKQCDILVYDSSKVPVIFRDEDFVIVRPESVRAVIEVKGSANRNEVNDILTSFFDFGLKWRQCQLFYKDHHQSLTPTPSLYAMCWDVSRNRQGRVLTDGARIREQIAQFYKDNMNLDELKGFPLLDRLYIYNECEISKVVWIEENIDGAVDGYVTVSGQFVRHDPSGSFNHRGDRTIASLLAGLHYSVSDSFNRFYSYVDETRVGTNYRHHGLTAWLTDQQYVSHSGSRYVTGNEP